jgi:glycosyltransferase involved in cell wall biosynthesis
LALRILQVVPTYLPATRYGGPIYSVHGLCKALAERGHNVQVFTTNVDGRGVSDVPLNRLVDVDGVKVCYFPTALGRRLYRSPVMGSALAASVANFDVVHLHSVFLWPTSAAARSARAARVPYVLSPRGMLVDALIRRKARLLKTAWITLFERSNLAAAAAVHMTAQIEAEEFGKLGLAARRLAVIPNGIDVPSNETPDGHSQAPRLPATINWRVLSLGRLNWKKGLERLIEAMIHVPGAELVLAGNDEDGYRSQLEQTARRCGVADRVIYTGAVHGDRKWDLIRSADVFVMPSYSENFGLAALEALACGLPVMVTPEVGLAREISLAGAGLVVDGEPAILGPALARLLAGEEQRRRMGVAARAAANRYSWSAIAAQMEELYADIVRTHEIALSDQDR